MKFLIAAFVTVFSLAARAEYLGVFHAPGLPDINVYKESGKLILSARDGSSTEVFKIITHIPGDDYNFGSHGTMSNVNGSVVEVLGPSGRYDGLLRTDYGNRRPVSTTLYLLRSSCGD